LTAFAAVAVLAHARLGADNTPRVPPNLHDALTSPEARADAIRAMPMDKLDPVAKAKVGSVLSNVAGFRRMPIRVVGCDPDLYFFLARHPDVVVNIWEVLGVGKMTLRQIGPNTYHLVDPAGMQARVEYLYHSHDRTVLYAEGVYEGPLSLTEVRARCLMLLSSGYVHETNGRYYVTSRLDTFISLERPSLNLLARLLSPLVGTTADTNFTQTIAFFASLSRTAELNNAGVQRLASKLEKVHPDVRKRFAELAEAIAARAEAQQASRETPQKVAAEPSAEVKRQ